MNSVALICYQNLNFEILKFFENPNSQKSILCVLQGALLCFRVRIGRSHVQESRHAAKEHNEALRSPKKKVSKI
jgi:hypothetical protein